jgi:hypothetical protein
MTAYRYYLLGDDGKICRVEVVECSSDAAALQLAKQRLPGCEFPAIEIWDRGRRIGSVGTANGALETAEQEQRASLDPYWVPG